MCNTRSCKWSAFVDDGSKNTCLVFHQLVSVEPRGVLYFYLDITCHMGWHLFMCSGCLIHCFHGGRSLSCFVLKMGKCGSGDLDPDLTDLCVSYTH